MSAPNASTFGLPPCLILPIAATSVDAIETYVGEVLNTVSASRGGRINALLVKPHYRPHNKDPRVKLWEQPEAVLYEQRLHPDRQVWVHVDYFGYRSAYIQFNMPPLPKGYVLDHIQNRKAIRLRNYSHPYLRLCPVMSKVNTSGGHSTGGEGMEKQYLEALLESGQGLPASFTRSEIVYADPMDITKMLDIPPRTRPLAGVNEVDDLLYPA